MVLSLVLFKPEFFFTQIITGLLIIGLAIEMIHFTRRSHREIVKFILAIRHGDVSVNFSNDRLGKDFADLADSFREAIQAYQQVKIEKETQFQLLQAVVDKISFGIIAFNEDNEILLINQSALDYLKIERTKEWDYIKKNRADFTIQVENMTVDGRKLVELGQGANIRQFSVYNHSINLTGKNCRVLSFFDIRDEIEQKEIEAWYKLIRVLTHEIMNSATPLISLTDTVLMLLEDPKGNQKNPGEITEQNIKDIRFSVNTIKKRSEGILHFVDAYRKLTDIPHPEFQLVKVKDLIGAVLSLLQSDLKKRGIKVLTKCKPESLQIYCDSNLMEQVLINLLTNSMYALEGSDQTFIKILAFDNHSRIILHVEDNGKGIGEDILRKIFIPFFSTREGGSGIGLSFSKFVVLQHGGRIKVESEPYKSTKFIIDLPKK